LDQEDWRLPRMFDGNEEMQKPPLYYWLVAGVARLRGARVDAWAVRLPAALAATACVFLIYLSGFWRGRAMAGFIAATVLTTAMHFTWLGRVGRIDMPLTLAVCITLIAYFELKERGAFALVISYVAVGVGVLLKGPIAIVLPGAVVVAHLAIE